MAYEFYITIEGSKQGKFKGESPREGYKDKIAALKFTYQVISPRDIATGQASGKRQHKPITFTKEWGPASPQLFQALVTNEVLKTVNFEFLKVDAQGQEQVYHTIKLTNATVSEVSQYTGDAFQTDQYQAHDLEDVSLTFQKIEIQDTLGRTMASDSWNGQKI